MEEAKRAMKPGSHLYLWAPAGRELLEVLDEFRGSGWEYLRMLAWNKGARHGLGAYRNAWEPVLVLANGESRGFMEQCKYPSVLNFPAKMGRTRKPWQAYKVFVEMSSRPGEIVVDPFCGTNPLKRAVAHVHPRREWMAGDVLSPAQVWADVDNRTAGEEPVTARQSTLGVDG